MCVPRLECGAVCLQPKHEPVVYEYMNEYVNSMHVYMYICIHIYVPRRECGAVGLQPKRKSVAQAACVQSRESAD